MYTTTSSERLARAMAHAAQLQEVMPAPGRPELAVAISRESGSGGAAIARALRTQLNWPVYDKELIQEIAGKMGLRTELLDSVDERQRSWLHESLEALASAPAVSQSGFIRHLVETMLALGSRGKCIIVGRGAPQVLPAERALRVRIMAPLQVRVANKARVLNVPTREAARRVAAIDEERTRFVVSHFAKDPRDPSGYDLVLNSARFSESECAELIAAALKRLQVPAVKKEPALAT